MKNYIASLRLASTLCCLLAAAFVVALPAQAEAQNLDGRLANILEQAKDDYDMLMFDEAQEALQHGLELAEREGLRTRVVAELFMMLGIVRHASQNESLAEDAFVQAIETFPAIELDPLYRTPALSELMERARRRARPPEPEPEPQPAVAYDDDLEDMVHQAIRRARAGEALLVEAQIPENLPVFRVYLHFRRFGESDFKRLEMLPTDAINFAVTLEANEIHSTQLEYYISAVNRAGDSVAEAGRRTDPFRVSVLGTSDHVRPPDVTPPDDRDRDRSRERQPRDPEDSSGFYAMLAFGTDFGFLTGDTAPTANVHRSVTPGLAPAFAHSLLDIGWRISELNNIGLYFRWQFSPPQDFSRLPEGAIDYNAGFWEHQQECFGMGLPGDCLLGLKYERIISTGAPELYSSVGFGVGRVRNWLRLKEGTSPTNPNPVCDGREIMTDPTAGNYCYIRDTVRTGWMHFGIGGGLNFPMSDNLDLVGDTYLMVHLPDTSINLDINFGLRLRL